MVLFFWKGICIERYDFTSSTSNCQSSFKRISLRGCHGSNGYGIDILNILGVKNSKELQVLPKLVAILALWSPEVSLIPPHTLL